MSGKKVKVSKGKGGSTVIAYGGKSHGVNQYKYRMQKGEVPKINVDKYKPKKPKLNKSTMLTGHKLKN